MATPAVSVYESTNPSLNMNLKDVLEQDIKSWTDPKKTEYNGNVLVNILALLKQLNTDFSLQLQHILLQFFPYILVNIIPSFNKNGLTYIQFSKFYKEETKKKGTEKTPSSTFPGALKIPTSSTSTVTKDILDNISIMFDTKDKQKTLLNPLVAGIQSFLDKLKNTQKISDVVNEKSVDDIFNILLKIFLDIFNEYRKLVNDIIDKYTIALKAANIMESFDVFPTITFESSTNQYTLTQATGGSVELQNFFNDNIYTFYALAFTQINKFILQSLQDCRVSFISIFNNSLLDLNVIHSANFAVNQMTGGSSNNGRISSTITKHNRKNNGGSKNKNKRKTKRHKLNATKKISRR